MAQLKDSLNGFQLCKGWHHDKSEMDVRVSCGDICFHEPTVNEEHT